jgi:hypothetical protein
MPNWLCVKCKQWPLAPNLWEWRITRANVSRQVTFFPDMAFGECGRVWRVRAKQVGECGQIYRVRAKQVGECRQVWRVLAKPLDECWLKEDRSFYAQITYFICIKQSSLHSLNSPNLPNLLNSRKTCQTCLSRVWRVFAKWFGECQRVWRVRAKQVGNVGEFSESDQFSKKTILASTRICQKWRIFGEYSNSTNSPASGHCLILTL